ncbi:dTMP kinase [Sphingomonas sp.]|uniref:dTMP kinase n=1 Tax=Sphingomonas sp. TaxID=28214 RepID=UPI0025F08BB4|nr:dTMP kinase [Sphingomonas sp.]
MRGRFITLEGGEGVGKSTQLVRLAEAVRSRGQEVVTTREPGGTTGAENIRDLLMTGAEDRWSARTEALLFAAARADHVEKLINPALRRGAWVICDRFIDSTRAYQGGADGIEDADILMLHGIGSAGLLPDRTLLLTLPVAQSSARLHKRDGEKTDRMGARDAVYHAKVTSLFETLSHNDLDRFRVIVADGNEQIVTQRLVEALEDWL